MDTKKDGLYFETGPYWTIQLAYYCQVIIIFGQQSPAAC